LTLRLGIAPSRSFGGGWWDVFETCVQLGFSAIEFKHELPFILPERFSRGMVRQLAEVRLEHGLVYAVHGPYVNIGSPLPYRWRAAVDEHLRALEVAQEIGAKTYTIHPGFMESKYATPELLARGRELTARALRALLSRVERITLCLENQNPMEGGKAKCAARPSELKEILAAAGEGVKLTWDVGHANLLPGGALGFAREMGLDKVAVIHLHDNHGDKDTHNAPGTGTVPWKELLSLLINTKGSPMLYLELRTEEDLSRGREFLERLAQGIQANSLR